MKKSNPSLIPIGSRSLLWGVHLWWLHPFFVAAAWWKLYGFPSDYRLWLCFLVHDWGYWGKPNMDGPEGETHPILGARIVNKLFDRKGKPPKLVYDGGHYTKEYLDYLDYWFRFCLYHSRFLAKRDNAHYSKLCVADKLSFCMMPYWLYLPLGLLSGEIHEYMARCSEGNKYANELRPSTTYREWWEGCYKYIYEWVEEHKDMKSDVWTGVK